jgi:hypothetical protein
MKSMVENKEASKADRQERNPRGCCVAETQKRQHLKKDTAIDAAERLSVVETGPEH